MANRASRTPSISVPTAEERENTASQGEPLINRSSACDTIRHTRHLLIAGFRQVWRWTGEFTPSVKQLTVASQGESSLYIRRLFKMKKLALVLVLLSVSAGMALPAEFSSAPTNATSVST